ncbi:transglutaminase [Trypanosoma theileri]|uniref:Transglutaminase n=1 Tax=Trypanosoma theileri TaxID=67003 RepID=A0A1X0NF34_9TRYP|nr:transglutaminase [Trypanosoma theileri]ORC82350.1 transglutaminase [Trypanosoma theileri]
MFDQLRRVVYLLVLLQFCACVVRATDGSGGEAPVEAVVERTEHDEMVAAENVTAAWIEKAYELLVQGRVCMTVWDGAVDSLNGSSQLVETRAEEVKDFVKMATAEEVKKLEEMVLEVGKEVNTTKSSIPYVRRAGVLCEGPQESLEDAENRFNQSVRSYLNEKAAKTNRTYWTLEKELLAEKSNKTYGKVVAVTGRYKELRGRSHVIEFHVQRRVEAAKQSMKEAKNKLVAIKVGEPIEKKGEDIKKIEDQIQQIEKTIEEIVKDVGARKRRKDPKANAMDGKVKNAVDEAKKQIATEREEDEKKLAEEVKAEREREAEDRRKQEQAQREREAEERRAQEQAQRDREAEERRAQEQAQRDREAEERRAQEQAQRDREAEERRAQEQAQRDREAEERRAQEKAQKEEEVREKKDKEEQQRRVAEEAKRAAEKVTKKKDGSSPALVHSPLLLILLCLLGCTLVC